MKKRNVRYGNLKRIGRGVMGVVFRARDLHLQRDVAVKLIAPEFAERKDIAKRFVNEARLAASLRHPNICPVYDIGRSDDGVPYMTMPLLKGRTLDRYISSGQDISVNTSIRLIHCIALAMQVAHDNGVVHRDLKPGNIMIQNGQPVVMDFGIAFQADAEHTRLTVHGQQLGSPAYMSPEQIEGDLSTIGPQSDIYALGVILFELYTGRPPFVGSLTSVFKQILIDDAPRPSQFRTGCVELDRLCAKAMAKDPADRFESMQDFANALKHLLDKRAVHDDRVSAAKPRWGSFLWRPRARRRGFMNSARTKLNAGQQTKTAPATSAATSQCTVQPVSWKD